MRVCVFIGLGLHPSIPPAGIQDLLDNPNLADPAQKEAYLMCKESRTKYDEHVRKLAKAYAEAASA